ncbi:hypothetical protein F5B21DRAFT_512888 [Xylaria acuta]|nr:hypothetical protein F5B21DRAFT_512888 [Xylaria acuta]
MLPPASSTSRRGSPSHAGESGSEAKRRNIRRGTHSCWECKRRKVRCTFTSPSDAVCAECQRRGTSCLGQEMPHLVRTIGGGNATGYIALDDNRPLLTETNHRESSQSPSPPSAQLEHPRSLPAYGPSIARERKVMFVPYIELERGEFEPNRALPYAPGPNTHPVLLAKYMFDLATALHYLDPETYGQLDCLSQKPHVLAKRLTDTARSLVTTDDELLGIYQANCGNLRRAWIAFRRAMVAGRLMGSYRPLYRPLKLIDLQVPDSTHNRFHCLMLGLPQGSSDRSMAFESALARDTPLGRLERIRCAIASRILERNDADPTSLDPITLKQIDHGLQEAAKAMPSSWWLAPSLPTAVVAASKGDRSVFWEMLRLVTQLYHYNLLNQLYLPYILRFNPAEPWPGHFQLACVNAFNRVPFCCHAADFFALVAALTLLLAHLDSHRRRHYHDDTSSNGGNLYFLAHRYLGDRALLDNDTLSAKSTGLLRRLLDIEAKAADGETYSAQREGSLEAAQGQVHDDAHVLRIGMPHFGTIRMTRDESNLARDRRSLPTIFEPWANGHRGDWAVQGADTAFFQ